MLFILIPLLVDVFSNEEVCGFDYDYIIRNPNKPERNPEYNQIIVDKLIPEIKELTDAVKSVAKAIENKPHKTPKESPHPYILQPMENSISLPLPMKKPTIPSSENNNNGTMDNHSPKTDESGDNARYKPTNTNQPDPQPTSSQEPRVQCPIIKPSITENYKPRNQSIPNEALKNTTDASLNPNSPQSPSANSNMDTPKVNPASLPVCKEPTSPTNTVVDVLPSLSSAR
eukprot:GHVP01068560.1.p1 GENE.GHVP01068560.1~~GHVP01068560.1.p1  ORF type:complete len:229 (+),score=39.75 GHVP01068560.1:338-1024(+)